MKVDHVLPFGGQWSRGATTIRVSSHTLATSVGQRELTVSGGADTVDISESGQNLNELEQRVKSLREYSGWGNFNIDFAKDDQTGSLVISIIDRDSGEVIRQIPPDEILTLRSHLQELVNDVFAEPT